MSTGKLPWGRGPKRWVARRARSALLVCALMLSQLLGMAGPTTPAQALDDDVTLRSSLGSDSHDGFPNFIHYFNVDGTGDVLTIGYCMNMGRYNEETEVYNAGWDYASGPLAYIAYNGYPNTTTVAGRQLSELGARTATAIAVYMECGYIEPGSDCHVPTGVSDDGSGGYSLSNYGPTSSEVREAAVALYEAAQAHGPEEGPWNHAAVRVYHAPSPRVQNMLVVQRNVTVTLSKGSADATLTSGNDEYSLAGATYEVRRESDDELVATVTTDADGRASCTLSPNERYYAVETKAPSGFVTNPERTYFQTGVENSVEHLVDEPGTVTLVVRKRDSATGGAAQPGASLEGAEFTAVDAHGDAHLAVTDATGTARFEGLPLGRVQVAETRAPAGYLPDTTVRTYHASATELDSAGTVELAPDDPVSEDVIAFDLELAKFADDGLDEGSGIEKPAAGVQFQIVSNTTGAVVGTIETNASGYADTASDPSLWFGTGTRPEAAGGALPYDAAGYTIHEVESSVPEGFSHVGDWALSPDAMSAGAKLQYIVDNHALSARLQVVKVDAASGLTVPLAGFSFQILREDGSSVTQESWYPTHVELSEFTTDETGTLTLPQRLTPGTYYLHETSSPAPYLTGEKDVQVIIAADATLLPVVVAHYADAQATGRATIVKTDAQSGTALAGAEFDVIARETMTSPDGTIHVVEGQVMGHVICDDDGRATLEDLPLADGSATYAFVETKVPAGYVLDATPHEFTLTYEDSETPVVETTVEVSNIVDSLAVTKVELGSSETTLPGTVFSWWNADAGGTPDEAEGARNITVGDDGILRIEKIAPGDWYLQESAPVPGYVTDVTRRSVRVGEDGIISADWFEGAGQASASLENDHTRVEVSKRDVTTEEEVPGASLSVTDPTGAVVDAWTSTGEPHLIERLAPGTYVLTETMTPHTYDQSQSVTFEVIETGEVQRVVLYDEPILVTGQLDKRQEIADALDPNMIEDGDGANRASVSVSEEGLYDYSLDFRNTSSTWVDELTVTDSLDGVRDGLAELVGITTPRVTGDYDGLLNVWYQTDRTPAGYVDPAGANATRTDDHENPWLEGDGRALEYAGWRLWKADVAAGNAVELSASDLGLTADEHVTAIRLEYGRVEEGFTTRIGDWDRPDLKDAHDDLNDIVADHDQTLSSAVLHMRVTEAYEAGYDLDNAAVLDLFRNGGGEGLEDHDSDAVTQTLRRFIPLLPGTGEGSSPVPLLASLGLTTLAVPLVRRRLRA